jgi:HAD superfamily hydrolase (TIGR01509 family)
VTDSRRFDAVVFDMDGVLVDTEPAFFDAVNELLAPTGKQVAWEQYETLLGTSMSVTWRGVLQMVGLDAKDVQPYVDGYGEVLLDVLRRPRPPLPGVRALLDELRRREVPIALATSSLEDWIDAIFASAGLTREAFDALVWRQMVERSKPAPDLYLKAAELLAADPARCIAIEDTGPGVASAKAAGMYVIQTRSATSALPPLADADLVLDSLEDFPMELAGPD